MLSSFLDLFPVEWDEGAYVSSANRAGILLLMDSLTALSTYAEMSTRHDDRVFRLCQTN